MLNPWPTISLTPWNPLPLKYSRYQIREPSEKPEVSRPIGICGLNHNCRSHDSRGRSHPLGMQKQTLSKKSIFGSHSSDLSSDSTDYSAPCDTQPHSWDRIFQNVMHPKINDVKWGKGIELLSFLACLNHLTNLSRLSTTLHESYSPLLN